MNNEFKKIKNNEDTRYVLENASSGGTSSGSVASVSMPIGSTRKRGDNILAQEADKKTVPVSTPRNFVAKNAKTGGAGQHKDKKKAEKQGDVKHRKPFAEQGVAENTATGINRMFNNLGDPVYSNLQRVALLAMQGRQSEAAGRLQSVIKDASTDIQKKITDAVNNIKPVTINGKIADSSTLDKSKQHNDWIINTFIPWVQSLLGQQGVAENFADGKNPQDKGDSARHGIPKKASLTQLDKIGHGSGRKAQLARWQANMRRGRAK